jgi:hypothetical protein
MQHRCTHTDVMRACCTLYCEKLLASSASPKAVQYQPQCCHTCQSSGPVGVPACSSCLLPDALSEPIINQNPTPLPLHHYHMPDHSSYLSDSVAAGPRRTLVFDTASSTYQRVQWPRRCPSLRRLPPPRHTAMRAAPLAPGCAAACARCAHMTQWTERTCTAAVHPTTLMRLQRRTLIDTLSPSWRHAWNLPTCTVEMPKSYKVLNGI